MRAISVPHPDQSGPPDGLSVHALLRQALTSARSIYIRKGTPEPRWIAVRNCLHVMGPQARRLYE